MKLRATQIAFALVLLSGTMMAQQQQMAASSSAAPAAPKPEGRPAPKADPPAASPLDGLNHALPKWIQFGGQFRLRLEGYTDGSFNPANEDAYLLTRLWLNVKVQPTPWLKFYAQSMDSHAPWKKSLPAGAP